MNSSEVEGTPLLGPLPLELQQIKAQKDAAAAALAARQLRSEQLLESSSAAARQGEFSIKLRRNSSGETIISPDHDAATRRSSRPIKRKRFDDELGQLAGEMLLSTPGFAFLGGPSVGSGSQPGGDQTGTSGRSRNPSICAAGDMTTGGSVVGTSSYLQDPSLVNSCQALPDLRLKKTVRDKKRRKGRREGAVKDLGRWKPSDDLALITAVGQTKDLGSVIKGVKFSCHFSLSDLQERWYTLLYDPVISKLALDAIRNLPEEVVAAVTRTTPFSRQEEDSIANCGLKSTAASVDLAVFEKLLIEQAATFHPSRSGRSLLTHWQYMKQYTLLPDQTVQPLPRPEQAQHILNFNDGEEQLVDVELAETQDNLLESELAIVDRRAKREIRRLEAEVSKWQIVVEQVTGQATPDFDNQTLAVMRGRLVRYLMRSREISVGRATADHTVDVDLTLEGPASKISRRQAVIKLKNSGEFYLANEGCRPVMVNGRAVITGEVTRLANNTVVEFCNLRFVFLINTELIEAIRTEAAKNQFVSTKQNIML